MNTEKNFENLFLLSDANTGLDYLIEKGMEGEFQFVFIDPPMSNMEDYDSKNPERVISFMNDDGKVNSEYFYPLLKKGRSLMRDSGIFAFYVSPRYLNHAKSMMDEVFGTENYLNTLVLSYYKIDLSKINLSNSYENILIYKKSKNFIFNKIEIDGRKINDVWTDSFSNIRNERVGYATQKPIALLERLLSLYSNPGDSVLDIFSGSGTLPVISVANKRKWVGIDNNIDSLLATKVRIEAKTGKFDYTSLNLDYEKKYSPHDIKNLVAEDKDIILSEEYSENDFNIKVEGEKFISDPSSANKYISDDEKKRRIKHILGISFIVISAIFFIINIALILSERSGIFSSIFGIVTTFILLFLGLLLWEEEEVFKKMSKIFDKFWTLFSKEASKSLKNTKRA